MKIVWYGAPGVGVLSSLLINAYTRSLVIPWMQNNLCYQILKTNFMNTLTKSSYVCTFVYEGILVEIPNISY